MCICFILRSDGGFGIITFLIRLTVSGYIMGIFKRLTIVSSVLVIYGFWLPHWYFYTLDQCMVCPLIYSFWLPHWYLYTLDQCIVCPLIYSFWLLHWYFYTFDQCIVCPLSYSFWLPHWYLYTVDQCIVCPLIYSFWLPSLVSLHFWTLYNLS